MTLAPRMALLAARAPVAAIAAGAAVLALAAGVFAALGMPVGHGFALMAAGAFGSAPAIHDWLIASGTLILTGLATAMALRIGLNNFGAEGQYLAGALAAATIGAGTAGWPIWAVLPVDVAAGGAAGALLMFAAGWLRHGVAEAIVTLLTNVVMLLVVRALVEAPAEAGESTAMLARSGLPPGLVLGLAAAVSLAAATRWTIWGFAFRALAGNAEAARFAGIPVGPMTIRVAIMTGALAGIAGVCQIASAGGAPQPGLGYAGIAVALLAALSPLGIVAAGLFVAALVTGAAAVVREGAPAALPDVFAALTLLASLIADAALRWRGTRTVEATP
jgi:simple sugar transport system permease protein